MSNILVNKDATMTTLDDEQTLAEESAPCEQEERESNHSTQSMELGGGQTLKLTLTSRGSAAVQIAGNTLDACGSPPHQIDQNSTKNIESNDANKDNSLPQAGIVRTFSMELAELNLPATQAQASPSLHLGASQHVARSVPFISSACEHEEMSPILADDASSQMNVGRFPFQTEMEAGSCSKGGNGGNGGTKAAASFAGPAVDPCDNMEEEKEELEGVDKEMGQEKEEGIDAGVDKEIGQEKEEGIDAEEDMIGAAEKDDEHEACSLQPSHAVSPPPSLSPSSPPSACVNQSSASLKQPSGSSQKSAERTPPRRYGKAARAASLAKKQRQAGAEDRPQGAGVLTRTRALMSSLVQRLFGPKRRSSIANRRNGVTNWCDSAGSHCRNRIGLNRRNSSGICKTKTGPRRSVRLQRAPAMASLSHSLDPSSSPSTLTTKRFSRALSSARTPVVPAPRAPRTARGRAGSKRAAVTPAMIEAGKQPAVKRGRSPARGVQVVDARVRAGSAATEAAMTMTLLAKQAAPTADSTARSPLHTSVQPTRVQRSPKPAGVRKAVMAIAKSGRAIAKAAICGVGKGEESTLAGAGESTETSASPWRKRVKVVKVVTAGRVTRWTTLAARVKAEMPKLRPISRTKARAY